MSAGLGIGWTSHQESDAHGLSGCYYVARGMPVSRSMLIDVKPFVISSLENQPAARVSNDRHLSRTGFQRHYGTGAARGSVAAVRRQGAEGVCAIVADEVVTGKDVIDLETVRASEALADVALEEVVVVDHPGALPVIEPGGGGGLTTRLASGRWRHPPRPPEAVGRRRE